MDHPAHTQGENKVTVPMASKALNVGERGIYHANVVINEGTEEEIAAAAVSSEKLKANLAVRNFPFAFNAQERPRREPGPVHRVR